MAGVRIAIVDPTVFRPVALAASLLGAIAAVHGPGRLWAAEGVRPGFFDQLAGGPAGREGLQAGRTAPSIAASWRGPAREFAAARDAALLYRRP